MYRFNTLPNATLVTETYEVMRIIASKQAIQETRVVDDGDAPF